MNPAGNNNHPRHELSIAENVARNVTMSSREIAELTGAGHDNVLKTIRALVARGVVSGNDTPYVHPQNGQTYTEILLNYRDTMVVVSGYSVELRARIIDRWQELEAQQAPRIPQTLAEALRLAADQAEQIEQQQKALAIAAPKAAFVDQYVENAGSMSFRQVAKLLNANERRFRQLLLDKGVMYYLGGTLTPYQQHIDAGRFQVKTGTSGHNQHAFTQARFTPKGLQWVAGLWASYQMEEAA
jgi:phage antirepressor YoqD-like protein